ncbi:type I polyketide synthase [Bosea sp. BIWAKO-01]|uniref:type I polyketide synthase n=1 Tax=Bosea sp. BIWAKO-01 TaxID=506668 RepID=UPI000852C4C9|nr:type I polyketide synthase [Bosea sp. BIWAKO-01]GAU82905.1 malonyl CoA-acyl carrier protein transacylase [Bosea sp. BIWAKO-01]
MSAASAVIISDAAIIGAACELPGAPNLAAFLDLLQSERNAISQKPKGRWNVERFLRPGKPVPGFAYTFAGGYLERPFAFDPAPFGLSPREVHQMDPQQRLLLKMVWRAFEDAGVPPSSVAGQNIGVYVGASLVDYQSTASYDPALIGSHFMTGNSLSILANRISYVFDLKGPSFTVDSACSSSFIALTQAVAALEAGEIDMAVVGGVNLLLSPAPFIGFSQARMLSPTGACRPFSRDGDGYVRAEGAVTLLLQRHVDASRQKRRVRAVIAAAGTNSDGWTNGISLPSPQAQQTLIENIYAAAGIAADDLAFVEAHGTGTKVGDPIEATAIGAALGARRSRPLPIGSVKSNIGHLEAASGLAGLLKSALALERGVVPRSLFSDAPSDTIDFADLNLSLIAAARPFEETVAGISNYGFGGSNAHVILRKATKPAVEARPRPRLVTPTTGNEQRKAEILLISAASSEALRVRAHQLSENVSPALQASDMANALGHQAERLPHRLAIPLAEDTGSMSQILDGFAAGTSVPGEATQALTPHDDRAAIFVFAGNGCQFSTMGKAAYASSAAFRREIDEIDALYAPLSGWSLADRLRDGIPSGDLDRTSTAQPLIFAVQSALTSVLKSYGLRPAAVVGHSIGEIAAAEAAGILSRADALRVVHVRSGHQELVRGAGRMLVLAAGEQAVRDLLDELGATTVDIAAINGPGSTTVAGRGEDIARLAAAARRRRLASVLIDVDYPFHSALLTPIQDRIVADLLSVVGKTGDVDFYSTVTGQQLAGSAIDARYWADNMRQPVRFMAAIEAAVSARPDAAFLEISTRPILVGAIGDILRTTQKTNPVLATLSAEETTSQDVIRPIVAALVANGVGHDRCAVFGDAPESIVALPPYPFQEEDYHLGRTPEAIGSFGRAVDSTPLHPLLGARLADGSPEWRNLLDPELLPYLNDHLVNGVVVVPATAFVEIALAAGDALHPSARLELDDFDILRPLTFGEGEIREVSTRYASRTDSIEIWSRKRLSGDDWLMHARGTIRPLPPSEAAGGVLPSPSTSTVATTGEVYAEAARAGLGYGTAFQLVVSNLRDDTVSDSILKRALGGTGAFDDNHVLHPVSFDAAFHSLFLARRQRDGERKAYLPIRFRRIRVWQPRQAVRRAITELIDESDRFKSVRVLLLGENDVVVASAEAAVFRAVHLIKPFVAERTFREELIAARSSCIRLDGITTPVLPQGDCQRVEESRLLLKAFAIGLALRLFSKRQAAFSAVPTSLSQAAEGLLETAGAFIGTPNGPALSPSFAVPTPEAILATIYARYPEANAELQLASQALAGIEADFSSPGSGRPPAARPGENWWPSSLQARLAAEALASCLAQLVPGARPVPRILIAGDAAATLVGAVETMLPPGSASLTVFHGGEWSHGSLSNPCETPDRFDLLIGLCAPTARAGGAAQLAAAVRVLAPDAPILIGAAKTDAYAAFLQAAGFPQDDAPAPTPAVPEWLAASAATGLVSEALVDDTIALWRARAPGSPVAAAPKGRIAFLAMPEAGIAPESLGLTAVDLLDAAHPTELQTWLASATNETAAIVMALATGAAGSEPLAVQLDALATLLRRLSDARLSLRLVVVTMPAGGAETANNSLAARAAIRGFVRVAVNEYPDIDLRLVDIDGVEHATDVARIVGDGGSEREWRVSPEGTFVNRLRRGMVDDEVLGHDERAVLHFGESGSLSGFEWRTSSREAPSDGEVEIEVAVSGLNYRDVLVALGILDDDLLGAGLTRAALGFECAGTVLRVGTGVTSVRPGDRVMGFAPGTFASHVTCPAWHVFPVPQGMTLEAAATIPVAFATAWYALVERGHLEAGEDVLLHGGAGGVGLAAIQIARLKRAHVLATARSDARRALARAAGADQAFESRGEQFEPAIRAQFGGVDLVLNSLAGSAMLAGFRLLKPFGRFLELGKRDFLDNSLLPLRPFVRNIAYSGVDLDELLAHDPAFVRRMMEEIATRFEAGTLQPLTHRAFPASDVGNAFRLMQASEHVGKIVVSPPKAARLDVAKAQFSARAGLYLVVGGTTGLGFATAKWLAEKGASTVALLSRRGRVDADLEAAVAEMRNAGVQVLSLSLDVRDRGAVEDAVKRLAAEYGPVRGLVHAAVHLDDGLIANLTPERLREVLRAKTDGIVNLDAALVEQPLDFFVAYSSATTMIGSPGQAAYVAANAFLEGFMQRRRNLGKPALAIGWGAISDVGILARDKQLGQRLRRTTGVSAIRASEALAHLGRLLSLGEAIGPVQYLTNIGRSAVAEKLALLKSPAFAGLGLTGTDPDQEGTGEALLDWADKSPQEALAVVKGALLREVAEILRLQVDRIDPNRPMSELGLDSLMALELHLALETSLGAQIALVGVGDRTLTDIAQTIVSQIARTDAPGDQDGSLSGDVARLAKVHSSADLSDEEAQLLGQALQSPTRKAH